jgi:hypothetical protein
MRIEKDTASGVPDRFNVGCENTWSQFGPVLRLDARTCEILITSLTLASELDFPTSAGSKMPVCPG